MKLISAIYTSFYPFDLMGLFNEYYSGSDPSMLDTDSCLVVWGGGDISPSLYNRDVGSMTGATNRLSERDCIEWAMMKRAKELNIPIIGICRGAQMLCALADGFLVQHVDNHLENHPVTLPNRTIVVNSIHHQMMFPFDVEHEMLAYTKDLSTCYLDVDTPIKLEIEPEFVYFPKERGFAVQWHPEYSEYHSDGTKFVYETLKEKL